MSICLVCGSGASVPAYQGSDRLYHTTTRQFQVVRCGKCGLLRLDPQPSRGELRRFYPEKYWFAPDESAAGRMEESWRRIVLRDHVRFVTRALRTAGSRGPLLDVGCGGGLFLGMMRERGFQVMGLDLSREAASMAWRLHKSPAVVAEFATAPLRAASLAAVTMFHVLEHLYDPGSYLSGARELLAPGGRLIVQVPNAASWQSRLLGGAWNGLDIPRHLFDLRDSDLEQLLKDAGFEVVRRKYFSLRDNPAGLASSLAPALDPMARRLRRVAESGGARLIKDFTYFAMVLGALPFAALEAACGAGSTVMIEARVR